MQIFDCVGVGTPYPCCSGVNYACMYIGIEINIGTGR